MRCTLAAIALSCLVSPAAADPPDQVMQVYQTCGMNKELVDEITARIGATKLDDFAAQNFLIAFNHTTPETHYAGPITYKDRPTENSLEFIVRDGETYCLFGVQGALREAILMRFLGNPT